MVIWLYYLSDIFFNWLPYVNSYIFLEYVCFLRCVFLLARFNAYVNYIIYDETPSRFL